MARKVKTKALELTERQREIFGLLAEGFTDREAAEKLGVSHPTVRKHIQNAMEANGVASRLRMAVLIEREETR